MQVTIKLYASFSIGRFTSAVYDYPDGTTIERIVAGFGLPTERLIQLRNWNHAAIEEVVHDGDTISLLPMLGGG